MHGRMIRYLTKPQITQVKNTFQIFDQDGSGSISIREFDQILKSLGQNLRQEQLEALVNKIDKDGNGFVDFDQFLFLVAPKIIGNRSERSYVQAFKVLDFNCQGKLGTVQLQRANLITQSNLTPTQITQILQYVQQNFKGKLDLQAALRMLQRMPENVDDDF